MKNKKSIPSFVLVFALTLSAFSFSAEAQTKKKTVKKAESIKEEAKEQKPVGPTLPLAQFIQQVEKGNDGYVAASQKSKGFNLREDEWKLYTRPNLIGEASYSDDQRLTNAAAFQGSSTVRKDYSLGIKQKTTFGLDATLSYKYTDTTVAGVNPTFFPTPHFIVASPVLELNQSLWRNFAGRQTRAKQDADSATARAGQYNEAFNMIDMKAKAETAYWNVVLARKRVIAAKGNLERAQRIESWFTKRSDMQLSDRSDSLQGQAIVATRKVELQQSLDDERSASRKFNMMRGSGDEEVTEKLDELKYEQIIALTTPQVVSTRLDVLAAQQEAKAAAAKAKENEELQKADISAFAQLSMNGRDPNARTTVDQSFNSRYPYNVVGVRLNVPLSMGTAGDVKAGYRAEAEGAQTRFKRKSFEAERALLDLTRRFDDSKRRLGLAIELEEAQRKKAQYEKDRRGRGRSTTYQVIQFEQDYATAQISRINLEADILNLYAELKTYGGQP